MSSVRILTPGGYRPPSQFRRVPAGGVVRREPSGYSVIAPAGGSAPQPSTFRVPASEAGGWKAYASWTNDTGAPVATMSATWIVPPPPRTVGLQTLFLFPGLENTAGDVGILQPVLQWGESAAGGGAYWSVASWFVAGGPAHTSVALVPVAPGDVLTGRMALTSDDRGQFSYTSWFDDHAGTDLTVEGITELTWCAVALEAYEVTGDQQYPAGGPTEFTDVSLAAAPGLTVIPWARDNSAATIGETVTVADPSAQAGRIAIGY